MEEAREENPDMMNDLLGLEFSDAAIVPESKPAD
jgi:hypothetical protein